MSILAIFLSICVRFLHLISLSYRFFERYCSYRGINCHGGVFFFFFFPLISWQYPKLRKCLDRWWRTEIDILDLIHRRNNSCSDQKRGSGGTVKNPIAGGGWGKDTVNGKKGKEKYGVSSDVRDGTRYLWQPTNPIRFATPFPYPKPNKPRKVTKPGPQEYGFLDPKSLFFWCKY